MRARERADDGGIATKSRSPYGLLAEFEQGEELLSAAHAAYAAGYRQMNGYTPFPLEGLFEALGQKPTRLPLLTLVGGIVGGCARVLHALLRLGDQLPDQRRRAAAPQLAGIHSDHVRVDGAGGVLCRILRHARAQRPCRIRTIHYSMSPSSSSPAAIDSFSASRPATRSSIWIVRDSFWNHCSPKVYEVQP